MRRVIIFFLLIMFLIPVQAVAGIYRRDTEDGRIIFTDNPSGAGYYLVRRRSYSNRISLYSYSLADIDKKIVSSSKSKNLDPNLVRALIKVESNFNPEAVSNKGAVGLMQLMPETVRSMRIGDPFDPMQNIEGGTRYLKVLNTLYNGNIDYVLSAYNAGEEAVYKYGGIPPYKETINFVRKVKHHYYSNRNAE